MGKRALSWRVTVFRPCGQLHIVLNVIAMNARVAKSKAMDRIYKEGHLAHFYKYVPQQVDDKGQIVTHEIPMEFQPKKKRHAKTISAEDYIKASRGE